MGKQTFITIFPILISSYSVYHVSTLSTRAYNNTSHILSSADVSPQTTYRPITPWHTITGGLGIFNPSLAIKGVDPSITTLVQTILSDPTITYKLDATQAVSADCQNADGECSSYLLPGGLDTVSPWPYGKLEDESLSAFVMKDGPSYQMDVWDAPLNVTFDTGTCSIYASDDTAGFQLCLAKYKNDDTQLIAGKSLKYPKLS